MVAHAKLPARVLAAFEGDDPSVMPDRAYALQYARAVAVAVGLDPEDVALRYEEWLATLPPTTLPPPPIVPSTPGEKAAASARTLVSLPRRISTDPLVWAVLAITVLAIALVLVRK